VDINGLSRRTWWTWILTAFLRHFISNDIVTSHVCHLATTHNLPYKYRRHFSGHSVCIERPYDLYIMHLCFDHPVCEHGVTYGCLFINSAVDVAFYILQYRPGHLFINSGVRCRFLHTQLPYWTLDMNTIYTAQHIHIRYGLVPYFPPSNSGHFYHRRRWRMWILTPFSTAHPAQHFVYVTCLSRHDIKQHHL
jgi:hypothetical protein